MNIHPKRGNKYRAKISGCQHGHTHDSIREGNRCNQLHLLVRAGAISDLVIHPQAWFAINGVQIKHPNGRRVGYKGDFEYVESGRKIWEDVKGQRTEAYVVRAAIFRALFPDIELREV